MTIRTALIEDVPLARERLRRMLETHRDVRFVGEAGDMATGAALLASAAPDLLFLDVTLPDGEGPDLLRAIPAGERPLIVFLTARADHAVPAFELEAVDYLLKPVGEAELARALDRVRRRLMPEDMAGVETHVAVRQGRRTDLIPVEAIDHVEVAGHYLCLHVGANVHLLREPIAALAERLEPAGFVRCHRSALVRLGAIESLTDRRNGDADLRLASGAIVPLSRTYRAGLEARLRR
jgi:two-component system LytT family response regulator